MIRPRDPVHSIWPFPHDGVIGSYGLDQCLDFVEQALASGRGEPKPDGDEWLEGTRRRHPRAGLRPAHRAPLGSPHVAAARRNVTTWPWDPRNSATASGTPSGRSPPPYLNSRAAAVAMDFVDTDKNALRHGDLRQHGHQRGDARRPEGRRSVAGKPASIWPARFPARPSNSVASRTGMCAAGIDRSRCNNSTTTAPLREKLHVSRKVYGSPRSTAFLAHGFRIAVHRVTGEIRILQSVQAYRRRQDHQPDAGAGTGRGRDRPGDRHDSLRADGDSTRPAQS